MNTTNGIQAPFAIVPPPPLVTIYRPVLRGDRWVARADVNAHGELVELQATASNKLAEHARGWYDRAAKWLGRFVKVNGFEPLLAATTGAGVFADLPRIGYEIATQAIPFDADVAAAAELLFAIKAAHPEALRRLEQVETAAKLGDLVAADALDTVHLVEAAATIRDTLPVAGIFLAAGRGDARARKVLAALRETSAGEPTRIEWSVDEYCQDPASLCDDIGCACADEIGSRIIAPNSRFGQVRRIKRGLEQPMLVTFRHIAAAYGG